MTWIFESPLLIAALGFLLVVGLGVSWISSGRKELLYALLGAVALVAGLLVAERMIITDREAITAKLDEIAADVQSNIVSRVTRHISPTVPSLISKAQAEMPNYQFTEMRVTGVHSISVDARARPRTAVVEFNIMAAGTFRVGNDSLTTTVPRWVKLELVKEEDGQWRVVSYEHAEPAQFMRIPTP